jgi:hypothetical protein
MPAMGWGFQIVDACWREPLENLPVQDFISIFPIFVDWETFLT